MTLAHVSLSSRALSDHDLTRLLHEDAPHGDLTTSSLGVSGHPGQMTFRARGAQRLSCSEDAARLIELAGATVVSVRPSGSTLADQEEILHAEGPAAALLLAWKVAQTLLEYTAGIASTTAALVAASRRPDGTGPLIACTRKTFPGTRALAARAVRDGGGIMHRLGLSETILLFPEHIAFAELAKAISHLRAAAPEKRVVVEVGSFASAQQAVHAGADVLQLEKFSPPNVAEVTQWVSTHAPQCIVAAAGGITPDNAAAYTAAGAHVLVTSWPYFAPPRDVSVSITAKASS